MKGTKPRWCSCMKVIGETREDTEEENRVFILVMSSCLHGFRFQLGLFFLLAAFHVHSGFNRKGTLPCFDWSCQIRSELCICYLGLVEICSMSIDCIWSMAEKETLHVYLVSLFLTQSLRKTWRFWLFLCLIFLTVASIHLKRQFVRLSFTDICQNEKPESQFLVLEVHTT